MRNYTMKYAMNIQDCHRLGTHAAAHDWCETQLLNYIKEMGFSETGLTARRTMEAYWRQKERDVEVTK